VIVAISETAGFLLKLLRRSIHRGIHQSGPASTGSVTKLQQSALDFGWRVDGAGCRHHNLV
jgi:hypothetical protein